MLKKTLAILSTIGLTTITTSSVVACGPATFDKLLERSVDPTVYKTTYAAPLSSWSTGVTMQNEDLKILANLQETLLKANPGNQIVGNIGSVNQKNQTADEWTLDIRKDAHWFDYKGRVATDQPWIKASDVANTLRYAYNSSTTSQINGLWSTIMLHADLLEADIQEISDFKFKENEAQSKIYAMDQVVSHYIQDKTAGSEQKNRYFWTEEKKGTEELINCTSGAIKTKYPDQPILIVEDGMAPDGKPSGGTVTFKLANPAPYFETMLTYLAFSPLPDRAIDWDKTSSGYGYGNQAPQKSGYDTVYYSGAYLPRNVNPLTGMTLEANQQYFDNENTSIRKIVYNFPKNMSPSTSVFLFETGDLSTSTIGSSDLRNWNKYVGPDLENPKFKGVSKTYSGAPTSWIILYNYAYHPVGSDVEKDVSDLAENKMIAQSSTRALIAYAMNRSIASHYYSNALDGGRTDVVSKLLRNVYTTPRLAFDNNKKDYIEYIKDVYSEDIAAKVAKEMGKTLTPEEIEAQKQSVSDSHDLYLHNDYIAYASLQDAQLKKDFLAAKTVEQKIQVLVQQVRKDAVANGISGKVKLRFLENGDLKTTALPWTNSMLDQFNQIPNLPFNVTYDDSQSLDGSDYRQRMRKKNYSMIITGWGPDYADPLTYLNTIKYGGDYASYTNFTQVIKKADDGHLVGYNKSYDDLAKYVEEYGKLLNDGAVDSNLVTRYEKLSRAEVKALYEAQLFLPLNTTVPEFVPALTYLDENTTTKVAYGTSNYRYSGVKMLTRLGDRIKTKETQVSEAVILNKNE